MWRAGLYGVEELYGGEFCVTCVFGLGSFVCVVVCDKLAWVWYVCGVV